MRVSRRVVALIAACVTIVAGVALGAATVAHAAGSVTVQVRLNSVDGPPVSGVLVRINDAGTGDQVTSQYVNSEGNITFVLDDGEYEANNPNFGFGYTSDTEGFEIAGSDATVTLVVEQFTWLTGTVDNLAPDYTSGQIWYQLEYFDGDSWTSQGPYSSLHTSGYWSVRSISTPGLYRVRFDPAGPDTDYARFYSDEVEIGPDDAMGATIDEVDVEATGLMVVSGKVTDVHGDPIESAQITVNSESTTDWQNTGGTGEYSISVPANQAYTVRVTASGYVSQTHPEPVSGDAYTEVSGVNFVLERMDQYRASWVTVLESFDAYEELNDHTVHVYTPTQGGWEELTTLDTPEVLFTTENTDALRYRISDGADTWLPMSKIWYSNDLTYTDITQHDPYDQCYFDVPPQPLGNVADLFIEVDLNSSVTCAAEPAPPTPEPTPDPKPSAPQQPQSPSSPGGSGTQPASNTEPDVEPSPSPSAPTPSPSPVPDEDTSSDEGEPVGGEDDQGDDDRGSSDGDQTADQVANDNSSTGGLPLQWIVIAGVLVLAVLGGGFYLFRRP